MLIDRLSEEADLCRNDGVDEIAGLIDEAIAELRRQHEEIERLRALNAEMLEALENCSSEYGHRCNRCDSEVDEGGKLAAALRARLAQPEPEPEPVAWMTKDGSMFYTGESGAEPPQADVVPLYRAPPPQAQPERDPDPSRCPKCGGEADNGHDRCDPPNPYHCTKCMAQPEPEPVAEVDEVAQRFDGNWSAIVHTGSVKLRAGDKLYTAPQPQEQPEPEPVAQYIGECQGGWLVQLFDYLEKGAKLYTAPPARQWVDLTKDEVIAIRKSPRPVDLTAWSDTLAFARAISEALKAKNGGTE